MYPPPDDSPYPQPPASQPGWVQVQLPSQKPIISYTLMGITIAIFALQLLSQMFLSQDYVAMMGMKVNTLIAQGQIWRLITPMFLHGSFLHIAFNMYALYVLGPGLERYYGRWRFLTLYLLSGFAGNVISFLFSNAYSLGSSTAIFGLLGAEGMFLYQNRSVFGAMAQRALMNVIVIAGINLVIGLSPGIDNWGHVGGLIAGTAFAWLAGPVFQVEHGLYGITLKDLRDGGDTLRAGIMIGVAFAVLAAVKIYMMNF